MLPASAATFITILALQFAGKIPVMLNWTMGSRYLEQMMQLSGAKRILTSWAFLERLYFVEFGSAVDQIEFLEDIKANLTLKTKLKGLFHSLFKAPKIPISKNDVAVILFTSGTETNPKGVPLTHNNILSTIRGAYKNFSPTLSPQSANYMFLPPFHSFGFTCSGFLSITTGLRSAYSPDPTDSLSLAAGIEKWKITHLSTVPNFLKKLLDASKNKNISSLRVLMTGGEKASPDLYKFVKKMLPKAILGEGYGVTECSPIITMQNPNLPPEGVGQLISNLEAITINPETLKRLPEGAEGEICVCGPAVFSGYLGGIPAPFLELEGKKWYRTGDIGHITPNQSVFLTGRLKRFVKLGGEMISLGAIEGALHKELLEKGNIPLEPPSIALCADERDSEKPRLILFSTIPLDVETANEILKNSGFSRLVKINAIQKISEIPLMAIGKTNYRTLQSQLP
jgi:long-chain-fatty-acid--[acyl-carrier-protein] ligase